MIYKFIFSFNQRLNVSLEKNNYKVFRLKSNGNKIIMAVKNENGYHQGYRVDFGWVEKKDFDKLVKNSNGSKVICM